MCRDREEGGIAGMNLVVVAGVCQLHGVPGSGGSGGGNRVNGGRSGRWQLEQGGNKYKLISNSYRS